MSDPTPSNDESAFDRARASWDFPAFAREFPRDPALDEIVIAFTRGDYARVRSEVPKLVTSTDDERVKAAARLLEERTRPDPTAKYFFYFTAALLVMLSIWWILHDGPHP